LPDAADRTPRRYLSSLYVQVLLGIVLGVLLGFVAPEYATAMKPLGDGFIKLVRMLIAPIIFTTVVVGIAQTGAVKEIGRIGVRALLYFEVVSTLSLVIGLMVVRTIQPGAGFNFDPSTVDVSAIASYTSASKNLHAVDFLLNVIPETMFSAFSGGEILQILLVSVLFGLALLRVGERGQPVLDLLAAISKVLFDIVALIMRLAPLGAFGAMAFTVGRYGVASLLSLGKLMAAVYITCLLFVFLVLGSIAAAVGFNLLKFLRYIAEEILIVLGTSSSETALPRIMSKLERLGCSRPVVGLVIPTGYSFNLDGTSIYMTMAALFVAQASNVHLTLGQELGMLAILMLTSKGAAAVTGSGFITLAATLSAFPSIPVAGLTLLAVLLLTSKGAAAVTGSGFVTLAATLAVFPAIPLAGLTLLIGVDRFMSEARSITNLIGNATATLVVSKWEGALDAPRAQKILKLGPAAAGLEKPL
jgi:aerobic C4-dicarboxylate transport protein